MPVILATQEAETRRIETNSKQNSLQDPTLKIHNTKQAQMVEHLPIKHKKPQSWKEKIKEYTGQKC
jgi:hypothetical protein